MGEMAEWWACRLWNSKDEQARSVDGIFFYVEAEITVTTVWEISPPIKACHVIRWIFIICYY